MDPMGPDYEATSLRCFACEIREDAGATFAADGGSSHGLYFTIDKKAEAL